VVLRRGGGGSSGADVAGAKARFARVLLAVCAPDALARSTCGGWVFMVLLLTVVVVAAAAASAVCSWGEPEKRSGKNWNDFELETKPNQKKHKKLTFVNSTVTRWSRASTHAIQVQVRRRWRSLTPSSARGSRVPGD
jgi:hypothetical protein